jgi:hypothetical protein
MSNIRLFVVCSLSTTMIACSNRALTQPIDRDATTREAEPDATDLVGQVDPGYAGGGGGSDTRPGSGGAGGADLGLASQDLPLLPSDTTGSGGDVAGTTGGSGGSTGSGGGGSTGGGDTCDKVTACGGEVAGTWEVRSSCLKTSGTADISYLGLQCLTAQITGSIEVTGTLTLGTDGRYSDKTVAKGSDKWDLDKICLYLSGTQVTCGGISSVFSATLGGYGYETFSCVDASSGGGCTCQGTVNSTGGVGLLYNDLYPTGKYTAADNTLSLGDGLEYSYCVKGSELTLTPKPGRWDATPYTGTIVFRNSSGGTGSAGGGGSGGTGSRELEGVRKLTQ